MYQVGLYEKNSCKQTAEMKQLQEVEGPSFRHIFLMF